MDYRLNPLTKKDKIVLIGVSTIVIVNRFSNMIDVIEQIIVVVDEKVLIKIASMILPAFIALLAFLGYIVTVRIKPLVENFITRYLDVNDKAYKLKSFINIFNPEVLFHFIPYDYVREKLIPGMSGKDSKDGWEEGEKSRFEIAYYRLKKIINSLRFFVMFTAVLLFFSLFVILFYYLYPNSDVKNVGKIFQILSLIILIFLSSGSLWFAFKLIQILFLGDAKDKKIIKENFPEVF